MYCWEGAVIKLRGHFVEGLGFTSQLYLLTSFVTSYL